MTSFIFNPFCISSILRQHLSRPWLSWRGDPYFHSWRVCAFCHPAWIDTLKYLLHSGHNPLCLLCGEAIQFPPRNLDQSPFLTLLILSQPVGLRVPEVLSGWGWGALDFRSSRMFIVSPSRGAPPSGTKTSGPSELKVSETESEIYLVGHWRWWFLVLWILVIGKLYRILNADSKHTPASE